METETILKQIAQDVTDIKNKLAKIEIDVEELDIDFHELRPEFIAKMKKRQKEPSVKISDFRKHFGLK